MSRRKVKDFFIMLYGVLIGLNGERVGGFTSILKNAPSIVVFNDRVFVLDRDDSTVLNLYREREHLYISSLDMQ